LLSIFGASNLFAQSPTGGRGNHEPNITSMVQWQVKRLTTLLDLTPGQQSSLANLLTKNATNNQPLFAGMRTANQVLHTAETANDSAGIQAASTQIGTITGELTANRSTLNAGIAQILTPDQLTKYKALGRGARGWGFGAGRGPGFGGPGGSGGQ
jgi:Spy/CpxP family protein refolding chaperone